MDLRRRERSRGARRLRLERGDRDLSHHPGLPRRKRDFPDYMLIVDEALISVYGSARQVEAEISHPCDLALHEEASQETLSSQARYASATDRCSVITRASRLDRDKNGLYRWYNDYALPDSLGCGIVTARLHGNDEDVRRKLNRTENVRPIPPSDPDFKALYARRNDAESINRGIDDSMWLSRAHSVGHLRQKMNLIGYALMVNSLALMEHRLRSDPAQPQAA